MVSCLDVKWRRGTMIYFLSVAPIKGGMAYISRLNTVWWYWWQISVYYVVLLEHKTSNKENILYQEKINEWKGGWKHVKLCIRGFLLPGIIADNIAEYCPQTFRREGKTNGEQLGQPAHLYYM